MRQFGNGLARPPRRVAFGHSTAFPDCANHFSDCCPLSLSRAARLHERKRLRTTPAAARFSHEAVPPFSHMGSVGAVRGVVLKESHTPVEGLRTSEGRTLDMVERRC